MGKFTNIPVARRLTIYFLFLDINNSFLDIRNKKRFSVVNHKARIILGRRPNLSETLLYKQAVLPFFCGALAHLSI